MSNDSALVRQWLFLKMLSARRYGVTVQEMAQELGVTEKTIRRDLDTFKGVGLPVEETVVHHGQKKWSLKQGSEFTGLSFNMDEALAIYMGRRFLEPMAGTLLWEAAQSAFKKIRACLGRQALEYLEKMAGNLHHTTVGVSDYSKKADLIDDLMEGIERHKATFINYQSLSAAEPKEYEVHPYGLTFHRGSLYLVASASKSKRVLHFKVDRIDRAKVGQVTFEPPSDFNLRDHLADSFGVFQGDGDVAVKIRFLPRVARYVLESKWHESQSLVKQDDGSVVAEFHLSNTEELKRWILSFGQHAVVLEPQRLRGEIDGELAAMQGLYAESADPRLSNNQLKQKQRLHTSKAGSKRARTPAMGKR